MLVTYGASFCVVFSVIRFSICLISQYKQLPLFKWRNKLEKSEELKFVFFAHSAAKYEAHFRDMFVGSKQMQRRLIGRKLRKSSEWNLSSGRGATNTEFNSKKFTIPFERPGKKHGEITRGEHPSFPSPIYLNTRQIFNERSLHKGDSLFMNTSFRLRLSHTNEDSGLSAFASLLPRPYFLSHPRHSYHAGLISRITSVMNVAKD